MSAWVARLATLDQLEPPKELADGRFRKIGVGARQHDIDNGPDINVVVLVSD